MATLDQVEQALRKAHEAGDSENAAILAKHYAEMRNQSKTGVLENALRGMSARGNQAMAALNPFSDAEDMRRIAAEQEWVKQNDGAGFGQFLADVAITAPAGGIANPMTRALLSGAIEGSTAPGGYKDKLDTMASGTLGAAAGEKLGDVVSYLAKPFQKVDSPRLDSLVAKAKSIGMEPDAAQTTGLKTLYHARDALRAFPSSSSMMEKHAADQRAAWQRAVFDKGGENADTASPEVMAAMKDRIGSVYDDVTSRNSLVVDQELKDALQKIQGEYDSGVIPTDQRSIVKKYLTDFNTPPVGAFIAGRTYQNLREPLNRAANYHGNHPGTTDALKGIRGAIDAAMERSLVGTNPSVLPNTKGADDLAAWRKANHDWAVMKYIEGAVSPDETINPNALFRELTKREKNRVIYGKGDQELVDLAKVGKEFIPEKVANSGTMQKQIWGKILDGTGLASGAVSLYGLGQGTVIPAAVAGAGGLASILLPRAAAKQMLKSNGYLTKGLVDMDKQAIANMTKKDLVHHAARNLGLLSADSLTDDRNQGLLNYR